MSAYIKRHMQTFLIEKKTAQVSRFFLKKYMIPQHIPLSAWEKTTLQNLEWLTATMGPPKCVFGMWIIAALRSGKQRFLNSTLLILSHSYKKLKTFRRRVNAWSLSSFERIIVWLLSGRKPQNQNFWITQSPSTPTSVTSLPNMTAA